MGRILDYPEKPSPGLNDYLLVDSSSEGTKKISASNIVTVDSSLTQPGQPADAKKTGDEITSLKNQIPTVDSTLSQSGQAADAKVVGDEITSLREDLSGTEHFIGVKKIVRSQANFYYITIDALVVGRTYKIGVSVATAGHYDVKIGTHEDASHMVDTLIDDQFAANEVKYVYYVPAVENVKSIRLSSNAVSWNLFVAEDTSGIEQDISEIELDLRSIESKTVTEEFDTEPVSLTIENAYYIINGEKIPSDARRCAVVQNVSEGDVYVLNSYVRPTTIAAILYRNGSAVRSYDKLGTGTAEVIENYKFTIPPGCDNIIVQSAERAYVPTLHHVISMELVPLFYKKEESDARYQLKSTGSTDGYGIRWQLNNNDDLGSRIGKAVGLNATIGIGDTNGSSNFDYIYPWSEMKRCNIITNANGADVVVYEGETGFALDGSNGDVYVRIPKFTIERKIQDGYEYRIIGVPGAPVHEAFIEDGNALDEIFVGAFEGTVIDNALHSYGGKIPTANLTGPQFLTAAKANDSIKCTLYDMRCVDAIWTLMAVEFGCRNSNGILGYGYADFYQPVTTGIIVYESATNVNAIKVQNARGGKMTNAQKNFMPLHSTMTVCKGGQRTVLGVREILSIVDGDVYTTITFGGDPLTVDTDCFVGSGGCITNFTETCSNALAWHTGRPNWINNSTTRNPVRYRWIENPIGSLWHELPDVTFHNLQAYMCKNMRNYEFGKYDGDYKPYGPVLVENSDNGSKPDETGYNYWVTELMNDTFAKALAFPKSYNKNLVSTKAFGAYYYLNNGTAKHIVNGGGFDHLYRCNMLTQRAWEDNDTRWYLCGARLLRKQIENVI